jgi:hypothetical protein
MAIGLPSPSLELQMCNDSEDSPPIVSREITATTAPCELSVNAARKSERDAARQSLDELFTLARRYKSSKAYSELTRISDLKIGDKSVEDMHRLCSCVSRAHGSLPEVDTQWVRTKISPFNFPSTLL